MVAYWVKEVKRSSSVWLKQVRSVRDFAWQTGYGAFSVSHWDLEKVRRYIHAQEEHHRKHTFKGEYLAILRQHQIEVEEQYLWD